MDCHVCDQMELAVYRTVDAKVEVIGSDVLDVVEDCCEEVDA